MASAGTAYVDVEARLDEFGAAVEAAVADIETLQVDVEADVSAAQSEIEAIDGGSTEINVEANTEQATENIGGLTEAVDAVGESSDEAGGMLSGLGGEMSGLAGAASGATLGIGTVVAAFGMAINAAGDAEVVVAETDAILASMGDSAVTTADHMADLSQRVMEYSGFSDEAIQSGANMLLMFDNIRSEEVFDRAVEGSADLARKMGTDVPGAARLLGRALQDPEQGMSRLQRAGIYLSDTQKEQVASFMAVGDTASAQEVILSSLEGRIGGLAEAYGNTMKGEMDKAREAIDELAEAAGSSLIPMMGELAQAVLPATEALQGLDSFLNGALLSGPVQAIMGIGDGIRGAGLVTELPAGLRASAEGAEEFAAGAGMAKDELDGLSNSITSYLDGTFALPEAQRNLRDSFQDLFSVLLTQGHSADDVAAALERVAYSTGDLGAASGNFAVAADISIGRLRAMRDAGQITEAQFNDIRDAIRGAQDQAPLAVPVSTPGAPEANRQVDDLYAGLTVTGRAHATPRVSVVTERAQFDRLIRDLDAADSRRFTMQVSVDQVPARAGGGPVSRNEAYLVGEQGPEMFVPRQSGTILSAPVTAGLAGSGSVYNVTVNAPGGNGDDIARAVSDELRKLERASR